MLLKELKMKKFFLGVFFLLGILLLSQQVLASTISGTVYDPQRNPLSDVDVELLDQYYRQVNRTRTDATGRYHFTGLDDGNYTVKVLPFRYDLLDQSQYVEINTINIRGGQGNSYETRDFYLLPRKGSLADAELGVIFAQEVPKEAEKAYEQAIKEISKQRREEGIAGLREAVKLFPKYYLALHRLGVELFINNEYSEAAQKFIKAIEVNPKNPKTLYYLGNSLYKMGKDYNKAAITALNQAYILAPGSTQILFVLGKAERLEGKYTDAEKHLLQAKKLSKVSVPEIHKELAQLYANDLKKYEEAADELELYLKASKLDDANSKQIKKLISDLREKAKTKTGKS